MTQKVVLNKSVFSNDKKRLDLLNDLVAIHSTLSPGLLMNSTSCGLVDALYVLILLFEQYLAEGYFLIYPHVNPEHAIQRRHFQRGLPKTPFSYEEDDGEKTIEKPEDYFYTLEFDLVQDDIEFVVD